MINQKTLIILRHGKAETGTATQDDHARRLTPRGQEAAGLMGTYLAQQGYRPDKVLCSTAARTSETFAAAQKAYGQPLNVEYSRKIYHASAEELLKHISDTPENVNTLLLVGHNPGLHQLALSLGKEGDEDTIDTLHLKFPTCALAVIELDTWYETRGALQAFVTPEMLGGEKD